MRHAVLQLCCLIILCACQEQIIHNLDEQGANKLLTRLHAANIEAQKQKQADGKWSLSVSKTDAVRAIKELSDARMLHEGQASVSEKSSVISSREDQRFKFERNLSREIERTLSSIDGVLESRVHLNLPLTDPLFGQVQAGQEGSASVLIIVDGQLSLKKEDFATLVAGASGVAMQKISVLISASAVPAPETTPEVVVAQPKEEVTEVRVEPPLQVSPTERMLISSLILLIAGGLAFLRRTRARKQYEVDMSKIEGLGDHADQSSAWAQAQ